MKKLIKVSLLSSLFFLSCTKHQSEESILPNANTSNAYISDAPNELEIEVRTVMTDFNTRVISTNIDSLQYYYNNGNNVKVNQLLGYDEIAAAERLDYLKQLFDNYAISLGLDTSNTSGNYVIPSEAFDKARHLQEHEIIDVFAPDGFRPTVCAEPQFSICLSLAVIAGLETAGVLGAMGVYLCYCEHCTGTNPDKVCGSTTVTPPAH